MLFQKKTDKTILSRPEDKNTLFQQLNEQWFLD